MSTASPDTAATGALPILYRDRWLVAVNKPAGLLVHRSELDAERSDFLLQRLRDQLGQRLYPLHRLDKPTSGALLFALDSDTARLLGEQFSGDGIDKRYLAVVRGWTEESGTIDYPLLPLRDHPRQKGRERPPKAAQPARTDYRRLASAELPHAVGRYPTARYSLLELRLHSGRRRQIRRHLKHIFHPVIGDSSHGDGAHNRFFREQFDCRRLLLHARSLALAHPRSGAPLRIDAPLCGVMARVCEQLFGAMRCADCARPAP